MRVFLDSKATMTWISKIARAGSEGARQILTSLTSLSDILSFNMKANYIKGPQNLIAVHLSRSIEHHPELSLKAYVL